MKPKRVVRIIVTDEAKDAVEQFCDREGMTETEFASRYYEQFGSIPPILQDFLLKKTRADLWDVACQKISAYFINLSKMDPTEAQNQAWTKSH